MNHRPVPIWKLVLGVLVAAAWAAILGLSGATAPAHAYASAHTVVTWGGDTDCIETTGASTGDGWALSIPTWQCSPTHQLTWDEGRLSGQWIGVDPIMGDAAWISCSIDDGYRTYTSFAVRGDGHDVTCLRAAF